MTLFLLLKKCRWFFSPTLNIIEPDKIIFLEFTETEKTVNIKVMNTFKGIIDTEKLGTIEYTSNKLNGHGLGLYSLFNKNTLYITTSIKNNFFRSEIKINKKPSS